MPDTVRVIGQHEAIRTLRTVAPAHVLLIGTPGMGKTHIAKWYAMTLVAQGGDYLIIDSTLLAAQPLSALYAASGRRADDYPGPVIIDEVHVAKNLEQFYPLLDKRPLASGDGWVRTFIFTTTDEGKIPPALISRLVVVSLKQYSLRELADIADTAVTGFPGDVRLEIARLSHGNPRRVKLLTTLLHEISKRCKRTVRANEVRGIMRHLGYTEGLYNRELEIMRALVAGPRSISTLAALLSTSRETVIYWETGLIAAGLLTIGPRGRTLTDTGRRLLAIVDGKPFPGGADYIKV